jgi:hypothetical protein
MGEVIQFPGTTREEPLELSIEAEHWPSPWWILGAILGWSI